MRAAGTLTSTFWPIWVPVVLASLGACGDGGSPSQPSQPSPAAATSTVPTPVAPAAPVDSALVGTWVGPIEGGDGVSTASATMTMKLNADGSMSVSTTSGRFHPIPSGTWSVSEDQFRASGSDIFGNSVEFDAPRSPSELDGTWVSGAATGTFVVTKQ